MARFCILFLLLLSSFLAAQETDTTEVPTKKKSSEALKSMPPWTIGLDFSYGYAFRVLESNLYKELVACRDSNESASYLPQAGLTFERRINNFISIGTGVRFLQTGFQHKAQLSLHDTATHEFSNPCDVYNALDFNMGYIYSGLIDARFTVMFDQLHPAIMNLKVRLKYSYVDVPLKLYFHLNKIHPRLFVYAGGSVNLMVKQEIIQELTSTAKDIVYDHHLFFYPDAQKWNFAMLAGAGYSVFLHPKVQLRLHADAFMQTKTLFDMGFSSYYNDYVERHYRIDLGANVAWFFGRRK
ncbi:MAG TPA: outer membrane beta-barrel protein [Bacteroidia bacterium]|nr:outer membrane beta-barrel protein [Bacteroidia bacterium]